MAGERIQRRLAAIMAADVVGYSSLMERDEAGTLARLNSVRAEVVDPMIAENGGRIVKTVGDGVLAEFPSAVAAVENALSIQRAMAAHEAGQPEERRIRFRIGINLGDVIIEGPDIHGDGVNIAARLEGLCRPGAVYVSGTVHDHVEGKLAARFEDLGEQKVKNIARPVRVYSVRSGEGDAVVPAGVAAPSPLPDKPSIAVLPFDNLSGDPEQEYFVDGIAEDIITDLSKISTLFVVARNSTFVYKGKATDVKEVGRALGVGHLLEGSVRKAGERIRINAQLIDTKTGGHLWADRYDGNLGDIFELQDDITSRIVAALELNLTSADRELIERKPTASAEAYDLYLRGRSEYYQYTPEHRAAAAGFFEQAIAADPAFAEPYGYLSYCRFNAWTNGGPGSDETLDPALSLAQRAVQLDGRSSVAHARLAWILGFMKRFDDAFPLFEKAIELDPRNAEAHAAYGEVLTFWGDPDRGLRRNEKAFAIDTIVPASWYHHLAHAYFHLGRYEEAILNLRAAIERAPYFIAAHVFMACVCSETGRQKEAEEQVAVILRQVPGYTVGIAERVFPYRREEDHRRVLAAIRKAGLPE